MKINHAKRIADLMNTHLDKHLNESTLRKFVRSVVKENFMSHSFEPLIGDAVVNTNPGCIHYGSEGIVITIEDLPEDVGKLISYQVTNNGDTCRVCKSSNGRDSNCRWSPRRC